MGGAGQWDPRAASGAAGPKDAERRRQGLPRRVAAAASPRIVAGGTAAVRAAARCGRPGPGGGRGRGHIWTRRQPPATSWRRRLQAAAAAGNCARGGGGTPRARVVGSERPRAHARGGAWPRAARAGAIGSSVGGRTNPSGERGRPASGPARANGRARVARGRRSGNLSREPGTLTQDVRGRRAGAWLRRDRSPPAPQQPGGRGTFSCRASLRWHPRAREWKRALGRAPLCPSIPACEGRQGWVRLGGARLPFSLSYHGDVCAARRRVRSAGRGAAGLARGRNHSVPPRRGRVSRWQRLETRALAPSLLCLC
ncbi:hypothetical protein VULLAG_LOCUS4358 [Vulpes lagopus]|uniref:translation initiation factor IF-2-like n=1 Tax=Vulpes lagopus TaxID=494514 RepID=UPI001BCA2CAD|nr:translation initiation factor IF-2-like [Vulpes lagopus]